MGAQIVGKFPFGSFELALMKSVRADNSLFWWRADRPLSGSDHQDADVRSAGTVGASNACQWWITARPLSALWWRKQPSVQTPVTVSYALSLRSFSSLALQPESCQLIV